MNGIGSLSTFAGQTITMTGVGTQTCINCAAYLDGVGSLTGNASLSVKATLSGIGMHTAFAEERNGYANLEFPALRSLGGYDNPGRGEVREDRNKFEALTGFGYTSAAVPETPVMGNGNIIPFSSVGTMSVSHIITATLAFPPLAGKGGDYEYAEAPEQNFPALRGFGVWGSGLVVSMIENVLVEETIAPQLVHIVVFTSTGQISSVMTANRSIAQQMIDSMTASGTFAALAEFSISIIDDMIASSPLMSTIGTYPALDSVGQMWCVNMDTGASSQYEQFGFNSFFKRGEYYYGVADDGIYQLDGDDDAGNDVASLIDFGSSDVGVPGMNKIKNVHVGTTDGTNMFLQVETSSGTDIYQLETCFRGTTGWRAKIPQSMQGTDWRWTLISTGDFELDEITFVPAKLSRRI